ncbi:hypothetical protein HRG_007480 [Hirsutella rhossiliensis]|uniref:Uncharacterized protein n=1 Tax=Hirsutella rhossiliensis TaxID=111463 RepID=A0A9P8MUQ4_9HYPO|nr:uncharacterized protein HRG_07480 [Hirsutella rhossiliensis]KAH0961402.1 hypothetical protein HRG_07480 [Hirsutella rhossiliensis]
MVCIPVLRHTPIPDRRGLGARRLHGRSESGSHAKFGILVIAFVFGFVILFIWLYIKHRGKGDEILRRPVSHCPRGTSKGKHKRKRKRKGKGDENCNSDGNGNGDENCNRNGNRNGNGNDNGNCDRNTPKPDVPRRPNAVQRIIKGDTANPELVPEPIDGILEMPRATYCRWDPN